MAGCKYLGQDTISGQLFDLGWYPGAKLGGDDKIVVDLYKMPDSGEILKGLDRYEGYHPNRPEESLFERKVVLTNEGTLEVWAYEYMHPVPAAQLIKDGDWLSDEH